MDGQAIVWLAGRLDRSPRITAGARAVLTVDVETGGVPLQVEVVAGGEGMLDQLSYHHADRGSEVIVRGRLVDDDDEEGDIVADLLAVDPAHATEGER